MSDGTKVARKRLMARYLWEGITTGEIKFPNGQVIKLSPNDILDIIQFLYKHIDGPPITNIDLTSGGQAIQVEYINAPYPITDVPPSASVDTSETKQV
jgi:hypothetical protein